MQCVPESLLSHTLSPSFLLLQPLPAQHEEVIQEQDNVFFGLIHASVLTWLPFSGGINEICTLFNCSVKLSNCRLLLDYICSNGPSIFNYTKSEKEDCLL